MVRRILLVGIAALLVASPAFAATEFGNTEPVPPDNIHITFAETYFGYNTSDIETTEISKYIRVDAAHNQNVSIWFTDARLVPPTARGVIRGPANATVTVYVPFPEKAKSQIDIGNVYLYVGGDKRPLHVAEVEKTQFGSWVYATVQTTGANQTWKVIRPVLTAPEETPPAATANEIETASDVGSVEVAENGTLPVREAGIRVPTDAGTVSVRILNNTTQSASMAVSSTVNTSRELYVRERLVQTMIPRATENLSTVAVLVDGVREPFSLVRANGSDWVVFEIDHFSTRHVEFRVVPAATAPGPSILGIPIAYLGIPLVFAVLIVGVWYIATRRERASDAEYVR